MRLTVNDNPVDLDLSPDTPLLTALRDHLHLTGTKQGCDSEGQCGACTVVLNGRAVRSCITPLSKAAGGAVLTVEGLGTAASLNPLQQALIDHGAVQCGYCTPGVLMSATALLQRNPTPDRDEILRAVQGNICRCTGYTKIIDAIEMVAIGNGRPLPVDRPSPIGGDLRRSSSIGKVTGATEYVADIAMPGVLTMKLLRSPHAHASITRIDTAPALALPGVHAVITWDDIPGLRSFGDPLSVGGAFDDVERANPDTQAREPILAAGRVRYVGEPVAMIVADDEASAQAGLAAVVVDYDELPAIIDPERALDAHAPWLHPAGNTYEHDVYTEQRADLPDEVVVSAEYENGYQDHVTMETEAMAAWIDADGRVVVHGPTQQPHARQVQIAAMLGVPLEQVRVITAEMGGSFGERHYFWPVVAMALPAWLLKRPVRCVFSREEVLIATHKRHPFRVRTRVAATRDGRLASIEAHALGNAGPYGGAPGIAEHVNQSMLGPYVWGRARLETRVVFTNGANAGAFRGYGMPQGTMPTECALDELAERLHLDPLALRLGNAADEASGTQFGVGFDETFVFKDVLQAARPHWEALKTETDALRAGADPDTWYGVGLAANWYRFAATRLTRIPAIVGVGEDGAITVYYSAMRAGQGAETIMSQLAADTLGVSREQIRTVNGDTDLTFPSDVYGGSRTVFWLGGAVQQASQVFARAAIATAAELLDAHPQRLRLDDEGVVMPGTDRRLAWAALHAAWHNAGQPTRYTGHFSLPDPIGPDGKTLPLALFVTGVVLAQVAVNTRRGNVRARKVIVVQDVGRAINPVDLEGQIEGAVMMELGATFIEQFVPGETRSFKQYRMPRAGDLPEITVIPYEHPGQHGPHGAKGIGEAVTGHIRAALVNATSKALGKRLRRIPATPDVIRELLKQTTHDEQADRLPSAGPVPLPGD